MPNSFLTGDYFFSLRNLLSSYKINEILSFENLLVFESANVFTAIFNIQKLPPLKLFNLKKQIYGEAVQIKNDPSGYIQTNGLFDKLGNNTVVENFFLVKDVGYNYWSLGRGKVRGGSIGSRVLYSGKKESKKDTPYIKGVNITKYKISEPYNFLRHNYESYLDDNDTFRFSAEIMQTVPKIVYRQTSSSIVAAIDLNGYHNDKTVHIILPRSEFLIDMNYVLGILNSKVVNYFYKRLTNETGRAFAQVKTVNVKKIPFIRNPKKQAHDKIVNYVDKLLELNKSAEPDQKQIQHYENQVDKLVYELYGLTEDEIKIIEEATSGNS